VPLDSQRFSHSMLGTRNSHIPNGIVSFLTLRNVISDRLPALSGIAKLFVEKLEDDSSSVAGHWVKALPYSLLWRPVPQP
jgi:hypothetical protein